MKTLKEMNKEETMSYAQEAMKFCQAKNLFLPGELEKLKAMRDAMQQALKDLGPEPERPTSYLDADYDAKQQAWEDWNIAYTEAVKTNYEANRQRDYAGLLELTESENVAEAEENCTKNGFITIICLYKFESYTNITS